ncbi:MAG TPA: hypothetical protein VGG10_08825 [Rhizomicrobium sp.]|jgi:hypothetical protein
MNWKTISMAGVAAIALVGTAAFAGPAAADPTGTQASSAPTNEELEQRIEALEAELQSAEMRQASDHQAVVTAAATPSAPPLLGWWGNTTVGGLVFFDFSNIESKSNGVDNPQDGTHFDIKRFYLTLDHQFDDVWSANLTTDFTYDSSVGATQLYIKKAYLQAHVADWATFRAGSADLPWVPFAESIYGYRYVENVLVDRTKFGTSADWGLHAFGKFGPDTGLKLEYAVSAVNGAGYKKPGIGLGTNRSEGVDWEGRVDLKYDGFVAAIGGYTGKLGKDLGAGTTFHTAEREDALIGYVGNGIHAGVEYYHQSNYDTVTNPLSDNGDGYSFFGAYQFMPEWGVFGRYDTTKPNARLQPDYTNHYYNVGVEWTPVKIVNLSLVYKHEDGSHGTFTDSNGTIGGSIHGDYSEVGLFGQFKF